MKCPSCDRESPDSAIYCACGRDLTSIEVLPALVVPPVARPEPKGGRAAPAPGGSGVGLIVVGAFALMGGTLLSLTGIGAICGLPLIIFLGFPMLLFGVLQHRRYALEQLKTSIRTGIVEGMQPSGKILLCPSCGARAPSAGSRFCGACGTSLGRM